MRGALTFSLIFSNDVWHTSHIWHISLYLYLYLWRTSHVWHISNSHCICICLCICDAPHSSGKYHTATMICGAGMHLQILYELTPVMFCQVQWRLNKRVMVKRSAGENNTCCTTDIFPLKCFDHICDTYKVFFFNWYPPKKLKYGKSRLGESTLT